MVVKQLLVSVVAVLLVCNQTWAQTNNPLSNPFREAELEIHNELTNYALLHAKYNRILPFLREMCADESRGDSAEYCNLKYLILEFEALHASLKAVKNREDRRFTGIHLEGANRDKYFSTIAQSFYLNAIKQSIDVREEIRELRENMNRRFDELQAQLKVSEIQNHYEGITELNINIADADFAFIRSKLNRLTTQLGAHFAKESDGNLVRRMGVIVGSAIAAAKVKDAPREINSLTEVFSLLNPIGLIKDNKVNKEALSEKIQLAFATDGLLEQAGGYYSSVDHLVPLRDSMQSLKSLLQDILRKLVEIGNQLESLEQVLDRIDSASSDEVLRHADSYVEIFKQYKPLLKQQHFLRLLSNFQDITAAACGALRGTTLASYMQRIIELKKNDALALCSRTTRDLETLDPYFIDVCDFQFELEDAFTMFTKGHVAKVSSDMFQGSSFSMGDDHQSANIIGLIMDGVGVQAAAHSFCNVIEYEQGGVRPADCKAITFSSSQIESIQKIARPACYGIAVPSSVNCDTSGYAFIPTSANSNYASPRKHHIDVANLLTGNPEFFTIPNDESWLRQYGWLGARETPSYDRAYFIERLELFIPGLVCADGSPSLGGEIKVKNDESVRLHIKAPETDNDNGVPGYLIRPLTYEFKWSTDVTADCQDDIGTFKIKHLNGTLENKKIKYKTKGTPQMTNSDLYPGLFTTWQVTLHDIDCELQIQNPDHYDYLVTANYEMVEWDPRADSDECWPNPCRNGGVCIDENKDYRCECPQQTQGKNCEKGMAAAENCDLEYNIARNRPTGMYIHSTRHRHFSHFAVDGNNNTCAVSMRTETPWFYLQLPWYAELCKLDIYGTLPLGDAHRVEVVLSQEKPSGTITKELDNVLHGQICPREGRENGSSNQANLCPEEGVYHVEFPHYSMTDGYQYLVIYEPDSQRTSHLRICEIEAFSVTGGHRKDEGRLYNDRDCDWSRNILGDSEVQVSQISTLHGWEARKAIDHHKHTCSRTAAYTDGTKPWFMITFPATTEVCGVRITPPYASSDANGLQNIEVGFLYPHDAPSDEEDITVLQPCGQSTVADPGLGDMLISACEELPIAGERLVIRTNKVNTHLSICDIEVFGTKPTG